MSKVFASGPGRLDPYRNFKFRLWIDGVVCADFREATGLDQEARPIGSEAKYSNITLKWEITDDNALLAWAASPDGKSQRRSGSIILMDEDRPVQVWKLKGAIPVKYTGPTLEPK